MKVECLGIGVDLAANRGWYPVAASADLVAGHLLAARLWGSDLVVWRDDNGAVNVWPDRCLHRGVRLSLGSNTGTELVCRYHGWRYASGAGSCTYIPAHPDNAPAQSLCTTTLPVREYAGLVWTTLDGKPGSGAEGEQLRPFGGADPADAEAEATADESSVLPLWATTINVAAPSLVPPIGELRAELVSALGSSIGVDVVLQPVDPDATLVRPLAVVPAGSVVDRSLLTAAAEVLMAFGRRVERAGRAGGSDGSDPSVSGFGQVVAQGRTVSTGLLTVEVTGKWETADGIMAFEFTSVDGSSLPAAQPGAHIDVHMAEGLLRPYSLTNGPGDTVYRIGVKREPESRGGSAAMHDSVAVGDRITISHPRNTFPLRRDAEHTLLIAGGIGVTPLLAMAQTLVATNADFELHYFIRGPDHLAFPEVVEALGAHVAVHEGLDPAATGEVLAGLLAGPGFARQVYACGPGPMLDAVRATAHSAGWPDDALHFEYFQNPNDIDLDSTFEIALSRSARTVVVEAGQTILDVLRAEGISVDASCEQGACGTCVVPLLDGAADHQDVYLTEAQKAVNDRIAVCVSRAETDRLILEL